MRQHAADSGYMGRIHRDIAQFPAVCFTLVLLTDIAYWRTANLFWQSCSSWLLLAGLVFGALTALAWIIELLAGKLGTYRDAPWGYAMCGMAVFILAFLNSLVHSRDGWTGVVPWGLVLSVATVLAMIACWAASPRIVAVREVRETLIISETRGSRTT